MQQKNIELTKISKRQQESLKIITGLGTFTSWAFVVSVMYLQLSDIRYTTLTLISTIVAICLTITNFLAQQNKLNLAAWLFIVSTEIIFITLNLTIASLGIILAITLLIIIGNLVLQTLSAKSAILAMITGLVTAITILLSDIFSLNPLRIIPQDYQTSIIAIILGGIIFLVMGIVLLSYHQFNSIKSQIIAAFIIISIIPLWIIVIPQLILINSLSQKSAYETILSNTKSISKGLDASLSYLITTNTNDAEFPIFSKFIENEGEISTNDILEYFQIMKKRNPNILAYSLLDINGKTLVHTRSNQINIVDENLKNDIQTILQKQQSAISDISFDIAINVHVFYVCSPTLNKNVINGILCTEINADYLQAEFLKQVSSYKDLTAMLTNQNGVVLAENSSTNKAIYKLLGPINQEQLTYLQKKYILKTEDSESLFLGLSDLQNKLLKNDQNSVFQAELIPNSGEISATSYNKINNTNNWTVIAGLKTTAFTESTNNQTRLAIFMATILVLATLAIAILTSNLLLAPINSIISMAKYVGRNDDLHFSKIAERKDEIGLVSKAFAIIRMELKEIIATIDEKVNEQTTTITNQLENTKQQLDQLSSIISITHTISQIKDIDELLAEITLQINQKFGFYHVGIFLTDQTGQYLILQAANSEGGKRMVEKGYQIKIGQTTDTIGIATSSGIPHSLVDDNGLIFNNPDLPNTRAEIAIPLYRYENIIGALDLQSSKIITFNTDTINNLKILANHISIAIENAQLLEETRNALKEAQVFYKQSATASWRNVLYKGTKGYRYLNGTIDAIKESPEKTGNQNNVDEKISDDKLESLIIPINIREKSLGILSIRQAGRTHAWSNAEIRVYQSIVDRISFALENARLYQDAQKRASKERVISEISTKVSSSVNMDNILQTAVEELGRVLQGSEIIIQLEHEDDMGVENRQE